MNFVKQNVLQNLLKKQWRWLPSGIALGSLFLLAILLVKPIGVSTQFVVADAIVWNQVDSSLIVPDETAKSGYASTNAYLNKSGGKYAKNAKFPLNYGFIFVISMILGGFVASRLTSKEDPETQPSTPEVWTLYGPPSSFKQYLYAFLGGAIALFGARLAGGCTSGHMMSGMMQTSVSAYLFAAAAFPAAIATALILYRRNKEVPS